MAVETTVDTKEAKDFLVQQTADQAARESVSLSDLEKRMMYFTESDAASCQNPIELNDEFESQYDTPEYEAKISLLLHHAYARLKRENLEARATWDQAIRVLKTGDHYLLLMWGTRPPSQHPTRDFFKTVGIRVLLGLLLAIGIVVWISLTNSR